LIEFVDFESGGETAVAKNENEKAE